MACVQCKLRPCDLVTLHRLMDPHLSFSQLDPGRILLHPAGHRLCRLQPPPCGVDSCVRRIWPLPCCHGLDHRLLPRLAVRACAERLAFLCMYSRAGAHNDPKQWLCYLMRPAMELHDARNWVMPAISAPFVRLHLSFVVLLQVCAGEPAPCSGGSDSVSTVIDARSSAPACLGMECSRFATEPRYAPPTWLLLVCVRSPCQDAARLAPRSAPPPSARVPPSPDTAGERGPRPA